LNPIIKSLRNSNKRKQQDASAQPEHPAAVACVSKKCRRIF
jgi:hypothetical protein